MIASVLLGAFLLMAALYHWPLALTATIIYMLLIPNYLVLYVSTELVSPSKRILRIVSNKTQTDYHAILATLEKEDFIGTRLHELCQSGCVRDAGGTYHLTPSGRTIAVFLKIYQYLLGREIGG